MSRLFITILNNALVSGWVILAILCCRLLFKRIPKWVDCVLWGLAAIRLVFPFTVESMFSLVPSAKPIPTDIEYAKIPQIDSGISAVNTVINPVLERNFPAVESASVNPMQLLILVASYIWVIGAVGMLMYGFISYFLLLRQVKNAYRIEKGIYQCDTIGSPFILGVFRPGIYIPCGLDGVTYDCVIEHEKTHIKRRDYLWKPLGFILLSVYWFHPLCWVAYIMLCKDIEYACDEKVTRDKDKEWKANYCQALLSCSLHRKLISACPVAFGEVSVKDRIKSVIHYKKPTFWIVVLSILICVVIGFFFLTNPKTSRDEADIVGDRDEAAWQTEIGDAVNDSVGTGEGAGQATGQTVNDGERFGGLEGTELEPDAAAAQDTDKEHTLTSYSFDVLIGFIERAMYDPKQIEENICNYMDYNGEPICSGEFFAHLYDGRDDIAYQNLGYLLYDLDGDGVTELLLGENEVIPTPDGGFDGIIYDLYSRQGDTVRHIFSGGPRDRYYITSNNELIRQWSAAADDNGTNYYRYSEGNLIEVDALMDSSEVLRPKFTPLGPVWRPVGDLNGDGRVDYVIYPYFTGYTNEIYLYLTGEGVVYKHQDSCGTEIGDLVQAVDLDGDGEKEILLTIAPHVNSMPLTEFAVLKRINGEWKALEVYDNGSFNNSFPLMTSHCNGYEIELSCAGFDKKILFDVEKRYVIPKEYQMAEGIDLSDGPTSVYVREAEMEDLVISAETAAYGAMIAAAPYGSQVGSVSDWGIWNITLSTFGGETCLVAEQGIQGYSQHDLWGRAYIYFNYDSNGEINILDLQFAEEQIASVE